MVGRYRTITRGRCVEGVGLAGGGYTSGWERCRDPLTFPEYASFGTTVSGVERPDCSAIANSSAQEVIFVGWGGGCDMGIAGLVVVPNFGGGSGWSP